MILLINKLKLFFILNKNRIKFYLKKTYFNYI